VFGTTTTGGGAGNTILGGGGTGMPIWTPTFTSPAMASVLGRTARADAESTVISLGSPWTLLLSLHCIEVASERPGASLIVPGKSKQKCAEMPRWHSDRCNGVIPSDFTFTTGEWEMSLGWSVIDTEERGSAEQ
jgi:hypothetical protein